jgi:hypothetical protein
VAQCNDLRNLLFFSTHSRLLIILSLPHQILVSTSIHLTIVLTQRKTLLDLSQKSIAHLLTLFSTLQNLINFPSIVHTILILSLRKGNHHLLAPYTVSLPKNGRRLLNMLTLTLNAVTFAILLLLQVLHSYLSRKRPEIFDFA